MRNTKGPSEDSLRLFASLISKLKNVMNVTNQQTSRIEEQSEIIAQMAELQDATSKAVRALQEAVFGVEEVRAKYAEANNDEGTGTGGMFN